MPYNEKEYQAKYQKEYRKKNRQKNIDYQKDLRENFPELCRSYSRKHYLKNREKIIARVQKYQQEKREKTLKSN